MAAVYIFTHTHTHTTKHRIKSYLNNRYQYVQFDNCKSDLLEVKTGIPQGSILGP